MENFKKISPGPGPPEPGIGIAPAPILEGECFFFVPTPGLGRVGLCILSAREPLARCNCFRKASMLGRFVGRLVVCGFRGPWIGSAKNLFVDESGLEGLVGLTGLTTLGIFTTGIVFEEDPVLVAIFLMLDNDPESEYSRSSIIITQIG